MPNSNILRLVTTGAKRAGQPNGATSMSRAPWTDEQVINLTRWQNAGHVHEYTCPNDGEVLIARNDGWHCPKCIYTQNWAADSTMRGPPPNVFGRMRL